MSTNTQPLADKSYLSLVWFLPLAYIMLLQRAIQLNSRAGLIVGLFLAIYGGVCGWLLWRIGWRKMTTPLDWGLLAMVAALVISAVFSIDPSRSWRTVWSWTACIGAFYMAVVLFRAGSSVRQMIQALLAVILVMVIVAYAEFFSWLGRWLAAFGTDLIPRSAQIPRIEGINGSPNILGMYVGLGLLLAFSYRTAEGKWPWLARLWCVIALPVIGLARSRSAFLGLAAGLGIVFLGWLWMRMRGALSYKTMRRAVAGLAVLGALAVGTAFLLRPDTSLEERNVSYRLQLWGFALETWRTYPVTGSGADTYGTAVLLHDPTVPPAFPLRAAHSWWFSLLAETGLLGMTAALFCWGLLLRFLWRHQYYQHWSWPGIGLLGGLLVFTVHTLLDTPEHWVIFTAALLLAGLVVTLEPTPAVQRKIPLVPAVWGVVWVCLLLGGYRTYTAVAVYEVGLAAAESGEWETAAERFEAAQSLLPYPEASFLLAAAYAHGVLAQQDAAHLPVAIDAYEQLIAAEPGWPTNHANLAALYRLNGAAAAAEASLERAIALAPQIVVYHLNWQLWQGGEAAVAEYEEIAEQVGLSNNEEEERLDSAGWRALEAGQLEEAAAVFAIQRRQDPFVDEAYLGAAVVAYLQNRPLDARARFAQAQLLGAHDRFWEAFIIEELTLDAVLSPYENHSTFGITEAAAGLYGRNTLSRRALPHDFLPLLRCFATTPLLEQNLAILANGYSGQQNNSHRAQLAAFSEGKGAGLRPCVTISR